MLLYFLKRVRVQLNRKTGLIESISVDDYKLELEQEFLWYAAETPFDGNIFTGLNSAMYKLRTVTPYPRPIRMQNNKIAVSIFKGCSLRMLIRIIINKF